MVHTFGDSFAAARTEGVFLGLESGHKYRVKSTDLFEELSWKYGANQMLLYESFKGDEAEITIYETQAVLNFF